MRRTRSVRAGRPAGELVGGSRRLRFPPDARAADRALATTVPRLLPAYRTGAMRHRLLVFDER